MNEFKMDRTRLLDMIAQNKIFHSTVTTLGRENGEHSYMDVQISEKESLRGSYMGRIYIEESDDDMKRRSLFNMLGKEIPFVIIGLDEESGQIFCSRKKAQELLKKKLAEHISKETVFHATILKIMPYGAFVDVGGVSGVLRTVDFSDDHSAVDEYYREGDQVEVICKDITGKNRVSFRAARTHHRSCPPVYNVEQGQIVLGTVSGKREFRERVMLFARIAPGLDCFCPMPRNMDVEYNDRVAVTICQVTPGEGTAVPRVRGVIRSVVA